MDLNTSLPLGRMAEAIRMLAVDAVQQANSGHPGAPMGMAEMAVALWHRHWQHNPCDPHWADRPRFVLSHSHASMPGSRRFDAQGEVWQAAVLPPTLPVMAAVTAPSPVPA